MKKKSIDKVTTQNLELALRFFGVTIDEEFCDIIIDVVEMLEYKGDKTTIKDLCKLQHERNRVAPLSDDEKRMIEESIKDKYE